MVVFGTRSEAIRMCQLVNELQSLEGIQEEAPSLGKPVLVMRDTTERREGIVANPYGDGFASVRIADILEASFY